MPDARRRDIRRWRERRAQRRRRVRLVGTAGVLVVALALVLTAAPGAHAPSVPAPLAALTPDLVERIRDVATRGGERTPVDEPAPVTATTADESSPTPEPAEPTTPQPAPQAAPQPEPAATSAAAAVAPAGAPATVDMPTRIVELTNVQRSTAGLPLLAVSPCATEQAAARAALLVAENRFEHDPLRPVLDACAAGTVGENLSLGYPTAEAAVDGWMASPGHRENILRDTYTQIGVACQDGPRGWLCAQVFLG